MQLDRIRERSRDHRAGERERRWVVENDANATPIAASDQLPQQRRFAHSLGTADDREWDSLLTTTGEHESVHKASFSLSISRAGANRWGSISSSCESLNWPKSPARARTSSRNTLVTMARWVLGPIETCAYKRMLWRSA